jgi:hypothetical protein
MHSFLYRRKIGKKVERAGDEKMQPSGAVSSRPRARACAGSCDRLERSRTAPRRWAASSARRKRSRALDDSVATSVLRRPPPASLEHRAQRPFRRGSSRGAVQRALAAADSTSQATPAGLWAPSQSSRSLRHSNRPGDMRLDRPGLDSRDRATASTAASRVSSFLRRRPTTDAGAGLPRRRLPLPLAQHGRGARQRPRPVSRRRSPRASIPSQLGVLERHVGEHDDLAREHVGRVIAAAETGFDRGHLDTRGGELREGGRRDHLELRRLQRLSAAVAHAPERPLEIGLGAVHADPLRPAAHVRRDRRAGATPLHASEQRLDSTSSSSSCRSYRLRGSSGRRARGDRARPSSACIRLQAETARARG